MSGYRRPAGGFYVTPVTSPASGYGSSLGRYDVTPVPTHYTGGVTRLVSSSGVPRRYQLYSRSDTPSGLTNYDVIRRAADPLAVRYRQNRHSWAAGGGGGGLSRSSTVASVSDIQWRRGRRGSSERAGETEAPTAAAAQPDHSTSKIRQADSAAAEAVRKPAAVSQPRGTASSSPVVQINPAAPPDPAVVVGSAEPEQGPEPEGRLEERAPVAPPRRTDPSKRTEKRQAATANECSQPVTEPQRLTGTERQSHNSHQTEPGNPSNRSNGVKAPALNSLALATTHVTEKTVRPAKSIETQHIFATPQDQPEIKDIRLVEPAKGNIGEKDGEQQRNKTSTSVQQIKVPKEGQMFSSVPDSDESRVVLKEGVNSALKSEIRPTDKPVNNSSLLGLEHTALKKQQEAIPGKESTDPVQTQSEKSCSLSQNRVKPAVDVTYQESLQLADVPVRPPRHIPASVGSKTTAVPATNLASISENVSNKSSAVVAPVSAQATDDQMCDGVMKAPGTVIDDPKSTPKLPDSPVSVKSSAMEASDSSPSGESNVSSTYPYSSSPETSTETELSDRQTNMFGKSVSTSVRTAHKGVEESEADKEQVKEGGVLVSSPTSPREEMQYRQTVTQSLIRIPEADAEPIDFWLGAETSDLAVSTDFPKSTISRMETAEHSTVPSVLTSSSGTADSQSDELSGSESVSIDSSGTSSVSQKGSEHVQVSTVSRNSHQVITEPEHRQPATAATHDLTSTSLASSKGEHPSGVTANQTSSSVTDSTETKDRDITKSSATVASSTSSESTVSTTSESTESSKVTRTSSASSCMSSPGSQLTDVSESEQTSSASEEASGSSGATSCEPCSPEPTLFPMDCTSAAVPATSLQRRPELASCAVKPVTPVPASDSAHPGNEHTKQQTEFRSTMPPVTTVPPTSISTEPATPMDTEPATPMVTEASMPTDAEDSDSVSNSVTASSTSQSNEPNSQIIQPLFPVLVVRASSPESDSSSICSECSTTESDTSSSGSYLTDSTATQSTTETEPDIGPVTSGSYSEQKALTRAQHPPQAVGTASSLSETAVCPTTYQSAEAMHAAPEDAWPAPDAAAPDHSLPRAPEASDMEVPQPINAITGIASPKPRPKPVQRRSKGLQPPAEVQRKPSQARSITDPARPARAETTSFPTPSADAHLTPPPSTAEPPAATTEATAASAEPPAATAEATAAAAEPPAAAAEPLAAAAEATAAAAEPLAAAAEPPAAAAEPPAATAEATAASAEPPAAAAEPLAAAAEPPAATAEATAASAEPPAAAAEATAAAAEPLAAAAEPLATAAEPPTAAAEPLAAAAEAPVITPDEPAVDAPAVVAPPRLRHRPPPADGADVETPAMLARRQRRIRRTASSPEVGDRLLRLDGSGERPPVPRNPPSNMTPLRRRMVIAQQTQKPRELMTPSSIHEQFMQVCIKLNESRFREVMLVAARIASYATINQTDGSGRTALSHLCVHGNGRCVEEFSRLPYVDANLADKDGNTPLHHAAQAGHAAVVSALLENYTEIEVDAKNGKGITPLIKACVQGKSKCAKLLLSHGADPLTRDPTRGLTCIEWSYYCGRHACARLVEAYLLARDSSTGAVPTGGGGGLKRVSSEPELAPSGGAPGWFRAKFRRLLGRCSPPRQPPTPPRQRRPSLPAAGEEQRDREAPPRPPACLPAIRVEEVEVAVDPVIVRYGDWVAPSQRQRQDNQVVNLCLPGTAEEFLYE